MDQNTELYGIRPALGDYNHFNLEVDFDTTKSIKLEDLASAVDSYLSNLDPAQPKVETIYEDLMRAEIYINDVPGLSWDENIYLAIYLTKTGELHFSTATTSISPETTRGQRHYFAAIFAKYDFQLIGLDGTKGESVISDIDTPVKGWELSARILDTHITVHELADRRNSIALASLFPKSTLSSPSTILQMIRMGGAENLIGEVESAVLEVKSSPYEMKKDKQWQCELAEDVARFANSENGGLLVIGIQTKKVKGQDRLERVVPIPRDESRCAKYHQVLDSRIHPPVRDLDIYSTIHNAGEILTILVPPQPETAKPYLVQGAYLDGKYEKGVISIVRRRDEHSIPITAREIHAMLAAGRALLQRGSMPHFTDRTEH
ncbi:AlbA family DNA-binding domain-containing protein [Nonomuraea sp. LPB2021202275-12-8]|uniref:AlbA family DNA-binding domain-containing protein n=1 Tax=Nonomuraea sp. LPB2021202275-12-8 TaxID=3120159 RepID=UPI00300D4D41